jgi:hypothetical protein
MNADAPRWNPLSGQIPLQFATRPFGGRAGAGAIFLPAAFPARGRFARRLGNRAMNIRPAAS